MTFVRIVSTFMSCQGVGLAPWHSYISFVKWGLAYPKVTYGQKIQFVRLCIMYKGIQQANDDKTIHIIDPRERSYDYILKTLNKLI